MGDMLSYQFEVIESGGGGAYFTKTTRTINLVLPSTTITSNWSDLVGLSYSKAADGMLNAYVKNIKICFENLVNLDKSISLEALSYDADSVDRRISSLTVK